MHILKKLLLTTSILAATPAFASTPESDGEAKAFSEAPAAAAKTFSTGVAKGRDLLDSAISASTLDEADVAKYGASTTAGIIGSLPGIRTETSGTNGFTAMTVRGLPLSGYGSKYLQIEEDGLPVVEFGDLHFGSQDMYVRTDLTLSQIQAIRGGSASTFASNSPGGIINLISKTGEQEGGSIMATSGVNYDLNRIDFTYGGPINSHWRFNIGGYYRQGEGERKLGYDAVKGKQLKINITRHFDNGFVRFYGKYLDDRAPTYGLFPLLIGGTNGNPTFQNVAGTNVMRDARAGQYVSTYLGLDQGNNPNVVNFREGIRGVTKSFGVEAQFDVAGWTLNNKFRFSANSGGYQEGNPLIVAPASTIAFIVGGPGATLNYASGPNAGQAITNPGAIAGNGLLNLDLDINYNIKSENFMVNDLRASRIWSIGTDKLTTTAGIYASSQDLDTYSTFTSSVHTVAGNGMASYVNVTTAGGVPVTQNGVAAYGFFHFAPLSTAHNIYNVNYRTLAPYVSANYQFGRFAAGASLRLDNGHTTGQIYGSGLNGIPVGGSPIDVNRDGVITGPEANVSTMPYGQQGNVNYKYSYTSYSTGLNYRLSPSASLFARYSKGGRAANEGNLIGGAFNANSGRFNDPAMASAPVKQAEAGLKFRKANYSLYLTGFWATTLDRNTQIGADSSGAVVVIYVNRNYSAKGLELEAEAHKGPFSITVGATYVKSRIDSDSNASSYNGLTPRHQPEIFFVARPQYEKGMVTFGAAINGVTSSYAQDTDVLKQPGYVLVNPYIYVRPFPRVELGLRASNVFDKLAIVQLGSSAIPASGIVNAQVMNGRTISASARFDF